VGRKGDPSATPELKEESVLGGSFPVSKWFRITPIYKPGMAIWKGTNRF